MKQAGVIVEEAHPDLHEAMECAQTLRALSYAVGMRSLLENHRAQLKPEVIWNIEKGLALTGAEISRAEAQRGAMFQRTRKFFETYDLLLCPTTIVPPFPVEQRYVTECNGTKFETYVDWLLSSPPSPSSPAQPSQSPPASPAKTFPSASRSSPRRAVKRGCWPAQNCWKIF